MGNERLAPDQPPVIGIIAHQIHPDNAQRHVDGQYGDYCRSVALAGGAPILIPLALGKPAWRAIYGRLDGLLFPGGVDVAPAFYGEEPHPQLGRVDGALDEAELTLAQWALVDRIPTLGICRGIQLINVAAGGTLYQDIPSQIDGALPHACPDQPPAHKVRIEAGTRLHDALGTVECATNSRHHQSIKQVAPGFQITARAPDGVIEGIELPEAPFFAGVQWHPENLAPTDEQMLGLFRAFVRACRRVQV
ncbi:MAG: gamma-glutamyl-gamma-aminobutyrate hydrolase family protein [Anaerolineae bacterium]|nr:gamma-glutamyl-gamma-aminobutyrate hydrolase family protein [Anaerolineae bacterium]